MPRSSACCRQTRGATKFEDAQHDFDRAQYDFEDAQYDFDRAQYDIEDAQYDFDRAQHDIDRAQYDIDRAQYDIDRAQHDFEVFVAYTKLPLVVIFNTMLKAIARLPRLRNFTNWRSDR